MTRLRTILRLARWSLADHLQRLRRLLAGLYDDLRETVTRAVGQTVAGVVQDTLQAVTGAAAGLPPPRGRPDWPAPPEADDWFVPGPFGPPDEHPVPAAAPPAAVSRGARCWRALRVALRAALA
jgi:hypothetical protein